MMKAIPNKLRLAFDLVFIFGFKTISFQQKNSKIELKPEEKTRDFRVQALAQPLLV